MISWRCNIHKYIAARESWTYIHCQTKIAYIQLVYVGLAHALAPIKRWNNIRQRKCARNFSTDEDVDVLHFADVN